jgi:hypothetical protein
MPNAPTEIPRRLKQKVKKKKVIKTKPQKKHGHCLLCWPADAKKKVGVKQEKVTAPRLFSEVPALLLPINIRKNITRFKARYTMLFYWAYF